MPEPKFSMADEIEFYMPITRNWHEWTKAKILEVSSGKDQNPCYSITAKGKLAGMIIWLGVSEDQL